MADLISTKSERLYSLDALRGFDMFWIMGAEEIFSGCMKPLVLPFGAPSQMN